MSPEEALALLREVKCSSEITQWVVAQEQHEDGGHHLHAFIKYAKKTEFKPAKWDIAGFHGNYQVAKSWEAVKAYCQKGGNFIASFDTDAAKAKQACGRDLNKRIIEEDLTSLVQEGVVRIADYLRLKACKEAYIRDLSSTLPLCVGFIPNTFGLLIPLCNTKLRHVWVWSSKPDKGKTSFLKSLAASFPCYWFAYSESFQFPSLSTQFVLMDEYSKAHLTVMQLNQMCDGTYQYPVKGERPVQLHEPVIILASNKPPTEVYPNCFELVLARFRVYELS